MPRLFLLWCFTSRIVFVVGFGILPYIGWWRYIHSQNYWLAYTSAWLPPMMSLTLWPTNQWIYIINNIFDNELQAKAHVFLFYCVSFVIKITWMTLQSTWFTFKHYRGMGILGTEFLIFAFDFYNYVNILMKPSTKIALGLTQSSLKEKK